MKRRRIAIGVSAVSGLAVIGVGAMNMFSAGNAAYGGQGTVDLHAAPVAAVSASGAATGKAGTAQVDTLVTMSTAAAPAQGKKPAVPATSASMHGTGAFDFGTRRGWVNLTVPAGGVEEVLTPSMLYARRTTAAPNAMASVSAKDWQAGLLAESSDGSVVSAGATDPALVFAMLAGAGPGTKYVGQDQVRGVPVVHYQGTLDLKQAADAADPAGVPTADAEVAKKALAKAAQAFATTRVPFDVYLDEQGRLRRFVGQFEFVPGPSRPVVQVTSATELFGFGTPVTVTVPEVAATGSGTAGSAATGSGTPATSPHAGSTAHGATATHGSATPPAHPSSPTGTHK